MFSHLKPGDLVAVMPSDSSPAADVLEIAPALLAGGIYVQLMDGRMYCTRGGESISTRKLTFIVPVTDEHWVALESKLTQSA
jgi:hypothetical protein